MSSETRPGLLLIGVMKLLKGFGLLVLGIGVLSLVHRDAAETLRGWLESLRIYTHAHLVEELLAKVGGINDRTLRHLGVGTLLYAGVFSTEGVGLILGKAWAEYMTTGVTVSFLPIEVYELVHHPSLVKALVTLVNMAVVIYLVLEIRRRRAQDGAQVEAGPALPPT